MRKILISIFIIVIMGLSAKEILDEKLKGLEPFVNKTYKGEFSTSTPEKPVIDVQKWEVILGGKAVRIMHSVNDGEYGGESIVFWDCKKDSLVYYYFTTAGFHTQGTMKFVDGKVVSNEEIHNNKNGITAAKSIGEILPDGKIRSSAEYLKNGEWIFGHEVIYEEDETAEAKYK